MVEPIEIKFIDVELDDYVNGSIRIKQVARNNRLVYLQDDATGECELQLGGIIRWFSYNEDGSVGPLLQERTLHGFPDVLYGKNDTLVKFDLTKPEEIGDIIIHRGRPAIREYWPDEAEWLEIQQLPQPMQWQGNVFMWMRDNAPLVIGQMIARHFQAANQMHKWDYQPPV
jgi:hypothetical protein